MFQINSDINIFQHTNNSQISVTNTSNHHKKIYIYNINIKSELMDEI